MLSLVFWQDSVNSLQAIPPALLDVFNAAVASGDPRFVPYFLDFVTLPTPFRGRAHVALTNRLGPYDPGFPVFEWVEQQGKKTPADDTAEYISFKRRLFSTIQEDLGNFFLDPADLRTISAQEILWGGVRVDGIPPLDNPPTVSAIEADTWMEPSDEVFGIEVNGEARAYPRRIIDWHEMVNDVVGGQPVSLAYCTLCGSAILYSGRAGGQDFTFGTSGLLYRSNKLMYDRPSRTLWEQYTGKPAWGSLVGKGLQLEFLPVVQATWADWRKDFPGTQVLDIRTGFRRDYGSGVAYRDYWADWQLMFPAPDRAGPLAVKDWVYVVRLFSETIAFPIQLLRDRGFLQDEVRGTKIAVFSTPDGAGARAYDRGNVAFRAYDADKRSATAMDGTPWRIEEGALVGPGGQRLARVPGHNSFWFSVTNHAERWRLHKE